MSHLLPVAWTGAAHLLLAVAEHRLLEGLGDREADLLARRNLDRLTGLRVASHACFHLTQSEDSETRDLDGFALLHGLDHGLDHRREHLVDLLPARPGPFDEPRHQLRLGHQHLPGGWKGGANLTAADMRVSRKPASIKDSERVWSVREECADARGCGGGAAVSASLRRTLGCFPSARACRRRGATTAAPPPRPRVALSPARRLTTHLPMVGSVASGRRAEMRRRGSCSGAAAARGGVRSC